MGYMPIEPEAQGIHRTPFENRTQTCTIWGYINLCYLK